MKKLSGIPVSDGIAIGRVLKLKKEERAVEAYTICEEDIENEISRFTEALEKVSCHVQALYESTKYKLMKVKLKFLQPIYRWLRTL